MPTKLLGRLLAALPDLFTAGVFLTAWVEPQLFASAHIDKMFLLMMLEFFVVHSSLFYAIILALPDTSRLKRSQAYLGLALLYLLMVVAFALSNGSTWPIFAFLWLSIGRFVLVWSAPADRSETLRGSISLWATSVGTYVFGAIAVLLLPISPLGMTPALASSLTVHGSFHPHQILAWGTAYFLAQAWAKFALASHNRAAGP